MHQWIGSASFLFEKLSIHCLFFNELQSMKLKVFTRHLITCRGSDQRHQQFQQTDEYEPLHFFGLMLRGRSNLDWRSRSHLVRIPSTLQTVTAVHSLHSRFRPENISMGSEALFIFCSPLNTKSCIILRIQIH